MTEQTKFTLEEAHQKFAILTNNGVWQLLGKSDRSSEENEEMVITAYASLYHWLHAGTKVNAQRGHWLLARVYTALEDAPQALKHATRCLDLTNRYKEEMKDFDVAYAYEALARALALAGKSNEARQYYVKAMQAGDAIANEEDKALFSGDLNSGKWFGIG